MNIHKELGQTIMISEVLTLSADASDANLPANLYGGYLFSVEIKSTADAAMTFSIKSKLGTTLYTTTTTTATSGEIGFPSAYWPLNSDGTNHPKYTLSGLGSGTVQIEITVVKS